MAPDLLPPSASPAERALAQVMARLSDVPLPVGTLWEPWSAPASVLPWLAWAFSVDDWDHEWSDDRKREVIAESVRLHQHKGSVWSVKRAVELIGADGGVEILEMARQRQLFGELGPTRLSAGVKLDGSWLVRPLEWYVLLPQVQHWAEFIVRIDLAAVRQPGFFALLRQVVARWAPVRSWPLWVYWLALRFVVLWQVSSSGFLQKVSGARFDWPGRVVAEGSGGFALGRDGAVVQLGLPLGSFRLGEVRGALSSWRLRSWRIASAAQMSSSVTVWPFPVRRLQAGRLLNGGWRLGKREFDATSAAWWQKWCQLPVAVSPSVSFFQRFLLRYPATPERLSRPVVLGGQRRLDGAWQVGGSMWPRRLGSFGLHRDHPLPAASSADMSSSVVALAPARQRLGIAMATKLAAARRKLDGSWFLGARWKLGRFALAGQRLRSMSFLVAPVLGSFALAREGAQMAAISPRPGFAGYPRLDGQWRVGGAGMPLFKMVITKEVIYG
ncbi:phage tail protein I [Chrysiogenes arsenatis]|uniref:phage tail protein I n=1 Tax=Chrysiogenes arsenatis TaxID=309797 RepID=UPI0004109468|nr:phage tail protein I [Chrysiogenes arsenatis]